MKRSLLLLLVSVMLSGCGLYHDLFGTSTGVQVGPQVRSGGTAVDRASSKVAVTKDGFIVEGELGKTGLTYIEEIYPDGKKVRSAQANTDEATPTKTSQGYVMGFLVNMSTWTILGGLVVLLLAVYFLPGILGKLLAAGGEAMGWFVRTSKVASIVTGTQNLRTELAHIDEVAKTTDTPAILPAPSLLALADNVLNKIPLPAQKVIQDIKEKAKAEGTMQSAK